MSISHFALLLLLHLDELPDAAKHRGHDVGLGHAEAPPIVNVIDPGEGELILDLNYVSYFTQHFMNFESFDIISISGRCRKCSYNY